MLFVYAFLKPIFWIIPWVLQAIGYSMILKKMGLKPIAGVIPIVAEHQISKKLFKRRRTFYRPAVMCAIIVAGLLYIGSGQSMSLILKALVFLIYGIFLIVMYWRLAKSFGKKDWFALLLILLPPVLLIVLGRTKTEYVQREFKPDKERTKAARVFRHIVFAVVSIVEITVLAAGVGVLCVYVQPPAIMINYMNNEFEASTKDVTGTGELVTREDVLGENSDAIVNAEHSRDYYYPDHSGDKNVVVMAYIIGSNLEGHSGVASANIRQMVEATKKGDGLKFIVEAGGSKRWFTKGIEDKSYGRYEIANGTITKIEDLPSITSMSEVQALTDFITWTKENYPADRNMLILWDHGGGLAYGYGQDDINRGSSTLGTITTSDLVKGIKKADIKFDIIGFDACLMQDIEVADALEPYADYYVASEEVEGGYGWFYTTAFGMLAENPGVSSYDFAKELIGCYDPLNTILKDGEPDTGATLSFVDLTLVSPAYDKLSSFFADMADKIKNNPGDYADVATAANSTYSFNDNMQIDLIDFLQILDKADYDDSLYSHEEKTKLIQSIQASVLMRNGASAKGVNGVAIAFPYKSIGTYSPTSDQFKALKLKGEKKALDEIFSIMAYQQKRDAEAKAKKDDSFLSTLLNSLIEVDYTEQSWYVEGFENYDNVKTYVDIPLEDTENGYKIGLPNKVWDSIMDCQTMAYQHVDADSNDTPKGAVMRYIGSDYIAGADEDGHPMIDMDGNWTYVKSQIVCYEANQVRETDEGDVYSGTIRACLNGDTDIILHVEWDPIKNDEDEIGAGHVIGYSLADDEDILDTKGLLNLEAGDVIQFMFDYYDAEGNLVDSIPTGKKFRVTKQSRIAVEYQPVEAGTYEFGGVLTDVYQRILTTEMIEVTTEEE